MLPRGWTLGPGELAVAVGADEPRRGRFPFSLSVRPGRPEDENFFPCMLAEKKKHFVAYWLFFLARHSCLVGCTVTREPWYVPQSARPWHLVMIDSFKDCDVPLHGPTRWVRPCHRYRTQKKQKKKKLIISIKRKEKKLSKELISFSRSLHCMQKRKKNLTMGSS